MKKLLIGAVAVAIPWLWSFPASALTRTEIAADTAIKTVPEIVVPGGHSVVLSFENDQYIQAIWVDDPAILGVATDRPLCDETASNGGCGFASSARLTRLNGALSLPGSSFSQGDGLATLITVITTNANGDRRQTYQFLANTTSSSTSNVSLVSIVPAMSASRLESPLRLPGEYSVTSIRSGRNIALDQGIADVDSAAWRALEAFISMVDSGTDTQQAIRESQVPTSLLSELQQMGELSRT